MFLISAEIEHHMIYHVFSNFGRIDIHDTPKLSHVVQLGVRVESSLPEPGILTVPGIMAVPRQIRFIRGGARAIFKVRPQFSQSLLGQEGRNYFF